MTGSVQRRGREGQRAHHVLPGELRREDGRDDRGEQVAACAQATRTVPPPSGRAARRRSRHTTASCGSSKRNPRSTAMVEAARITSQSRGANSRANSQATSASPARFQPRCSKIEMHQVPRQQAPPCRGPGSRRARTATDRAARRGATASLQRPGRAPPPRARHARRIAPVEEVVRGSRRAPVTAAGVCYDRANLPSNHGTPHDIRTSHATVRAANAASP